MKKLNRDRRSDLHYFEIAIDICRDCGSRIHSKYKGLPCPQKEAIPSFSMMPVPD